MTGALLRACAWIDARIPDIAVALPAEPARQMAAIKAVGDLANAGDVLARDASPELSAIGQRWLEVADQQLGRGDRIRDLVVASPLYVLAALAFLPLHLSGRRAPHLYASIDDQIRRAVLPPLAWTMLVPALEIFGIEPAAAMRGEARRTSVLAHRTAAARLPQDAAYLLVHECVYATLSGRTAPAWDPETAAYVARALPELVERWCGEGDADLLAETIVAVHATSRGCVDPRAFRVLAAAQTSAGNVEPPGTLVTMFPRLEHPILTRTFHTTLVAIMAWSACGHAART